jgi:hypothetical protein
VPKVVDALSSVPKDEPEVQKPEVPKAEVYQAPVQLELAFNDHDEDM